MGRCRRTQLFRSSSGGGTELTTRFFHVRSNFGGRVLGSFKLRVLVVRIESLLSWQNTS